MPEVIHRHINLCEEKGGVPCCLFLAHGRQSACKFFSPVTAKNYRSPSPILPECEYIRFSRQRETGKQWDYPRCMSKDAWLEAMKWKRGKGGRDQRKKSLGRFQHFNQSIQVRGKR